VDTVNTAAKAHGLDGSLVEPDWPPLTPPEIRAILRQFPDLQPPFEILSSSPRPLSAAGVVSTRNQRVFVKRHARPVRDAEGLREEHRFLQHLHAQGAPVPDVLANRDSETAIESGPWTYEVHAIPGGIDAYEDAISWTPFRSAAHARSAGEMLARLHLAAQNYDAPARPPRPLVAAFTIFASYNPQAKLDIYVAHRPALHSYLAQRTCAAEALELLAPFHAELLPLLPHLPSLWTHNDLHPSNLFWTDAGPNAHATAVIDFGLCDRTNAVHDLAHAIERSIVEWLVLVNDPAHPDSVPVHLDHLRALLGGYQSVRPLSRQEAAALAPMLALCHFEFALSESDYFLSVLHSDEKAYMAIEGYLLAHAQWWRGAGARLLEPLRQCADGAARGAIAP
jgi:Ser/Thr protein kinase RdoA (MazF antagonist)